MNSNKMLLTTALLAVLGINYSFQVNSLKLQQSGVFELAQKAPPVESSASAPKKTPAQSKPLAAKKSTQPKPSKKQDDKKEPDASPDVVIQLKSETTIQSLESKTEAGSTATASEDKSGKAYLIEGDVLKQPCTACAEIANGAKIQLTMTDALREILVKVSPTAAASETTKVAESKEENKNECMIAENPAKESRSERKEREECELKAKAYQLEDAFITAMDNLKDKCERRSDDELQCLVDGFAKEVKDKKYYSKGRKEILNANFIKKEFRELVGTKLTKKLNTVDVNDPESLSELKSFITTFVDALPENFDLKKLTLDSFKSHMTAKANSVVQLYNQARAADKTNPEIAMMHREQAKVEAYDFIQSTNSILEGIKDSEYLQDSTVFKYYNASYLPNIRKMVMAVNNPFAKDINGNLATLDTNTSTSSNDKTQVTTTASTRTSQTRGASDQTVNSGSRAGNSQQQDGSFKINGQGAQWTINPSQQNLKVHAPSPTSTIPDRQTRGSNSGLTAPSRVGNINSNNTEF